MKSCFILVLVLLTLCGGAQNDSLMREQKMDTLIRKGDQYFANCNEDSANYYYDLALELRHFGNGRKQAHIAERRAEMSIPEWCMQKNMEVMYNRAIQQGDSAMRLNNFRKTKQFYRKASELKPAEQYPRDQIEVIDRQVICGRWHYDDAIRSADSLFINKQFGQAKLRYQEALALITTESYPKDQIKKCDDSIAIRLEQEYNSHIKQGDSLFIAKEYRQAKLSYEHASALKPDVQYPVLQITKCNEFRVAEMDEDSFAFHKKIVKADAAFRKGKYLKAKRLYQKALIMRPLEIYPRRMSHICDEKIAEEK